MIKIDPICARQGDPGASTQGTAMKTLAKKWGSSILMAPVVLLCCFACKTGVEQEDSATHTQHAMIFEKLASDLTHITFSNDLNETDTLNYFTYPYLYMGGGVSVGDINNDGLVDIFFTGNMVSNRLYLNKGNLTFEDITQKAGLGGDSRWYTGSTMADVNHDGLLDIYVSVAGQSGDRENQLYINQGDLMFKEQAADYGVNDTGSSVNATFFDYDRDGDLDLYVANYPITPFSATTFQYTQLMKRVNDTNSDHLYRNDDGHFTKVTEEAGVLRYSLSLSATVGDLNRDGWPDVYVSNDFNSPDCMYINNGDGTFTDHIKTATSHTSFYGMGVDIADYNNDGFVDILQMDMDAESNRRSKANMASMDPKLFSDIEQAGFQTQYMQNSLQVNTGMIIDGGPRFSDVSRFAGLSSTDWSWGPLFADLDNDGWKDVFVSNGTRREINNKDYFKALEGEKRHKDSLLAKSLRIPSEKIDNYVFRNKGDLSFEKANPYWGISHEGFSNGSAYTDLDNDGDLEIIINNIDEEAVLFENKSAEKSRYLVVNFQGTKKNRFGIGAKVTLKTDTLLQYQELTLTRGFQSSVAPELHFGLGDFERVEELQVTWPDGKQQILTDLTTNRRITLNYAESGPGARQAGYAPQATIFEHDIALDSVYKHKENVFDDFKYEVLLPHKMSNFGPGIAVGDLNGDQRDDFYIGAASGYPGGMFFQNSDGSFTQQKTALLLQDIDFEDMGALIFDADQDGDNDLYIISGGNEFEHDSPMLQDRLYVNDGQGNFVKYPAALPKMLTSGSRVYANDIDKDGDLDLFIGGRLVPGNYPYPANSHLLENISTKGVPKFQDITSEAAPFLDRLGLVTSAAFTDIDQDGWDDLIVAGEWMPIKVFRNRQGKFVDVSKKMDLVETVGWWFSLAPGDFDNDGDVDIIAGNLGQNYKYKANKHETFDIHFNDFDGNKRNDIVLSYFDEGKKYPVRGRECSSQQVPSIKKKFETYNEFSTATLTEIYDESMLEEGLHYQVSSFASVYLENDNGRFIIHQLPVEAQLAPINQILAKDFDLDGYSDLVVAGNLYASEVETPRADAGYGLFLKGNGSGNFEPVPPVKSGLFTPGDVKDLAFIEIKGQHYILSAKNDDFLQFTKCSVPPVTPALLGGR